MQNPLTVIKSKLSEAMWMFIATGIILLILSVLIVWTEAVLKLLVGLTVLLVAYGFFYAAYKIHSVRKLID